MEDVIDSRVASIAPSRATEEQDDINSMNPPQYKRQRASPEASEEPSSPRHGNQKRKMGATPKVNWNAGTKAKIRTSLGDKDGTRKRNGANPRKQMAGTKRQMAGE